MITIYLVVCFAVAIVMVCNDYKKPPGSVVYKKSYIPKIDAATNEKIIHYKQQISDYLRIYDLTEKELKNAETVAQRKKALSSLANLDNKIFTLQQKINRLENSTE